MRLWFFLSLFLCCGIPSALAVSDARLAELGNELTRWKAEPQSAVAALEKIRDAAQSGPHKNAAWVLAQVTQYMAAVADTSGQSPQDALLRMQQYTAILDGFSQRNRGFIPARQSQELLLRFFERLTEDPIITQPHFMEAYRQRQIGIIARWQKAEALPEEFLSRALRSLEKRSIWDTFDLLDRLHGNPAAEAQLLRMAEEAKFVSRSDFVRYGPTDHYETQHLTQKIFRQLDAEAVRKNPAQLERLKKLLAADATQLKGAVLLYANPELAKAVGNLPVTTRASMSLHELTERRIQLLYDEGVLSPRDSHERAAQIHLQEMRNHSKTVYQTVFREETLALLQMQEQGFILYPERLSLAMDHATRLYSDDPAFAPALAKWVKFSGSQQVRGDALEALHGMRPKDPALQRLLVEALEDVSPEVQKRAALVLAQAGYLDAENTALLRSKLAAIDADLVPGNDKELSEALTKLREKHDPLSFRIAHKDGCQRNFRLIINSKQP